MSQVVETDSPTLGFLQVSFKIATPKDLMTNWVSTLLVKEDRTEFSSGITKNVPADLKSAIQITAGLQHACALAENRVLCWGENKFKQIDVPADLGDVTQVMAGSLHTCALSVQGVRRPQMLGIQ